MKILFKKLLWIVFSLLFSSHKYCLWYHGYSDYITYRGRSLASTFILCCVLLIRCSLVMTQSQKFNLSNCWLSLGKYYMALEKLIFWWLKYISYLNYSCYGCETSPDDSQNNLLDNKCSITLWQLCHNSEVIIFKKVFRVYKINQYANG